MSETIDHLLSELRREAHDDVHRLLLDHGTTFEPAVPPPGLPDPVELKHRLSLSP
jgi:hypothetical protein